MKKILFFLLFYSTIGFAQKINIGLLHEHVVKVIEFSVKDGSYILFADSNFIENIVISEEKLKIEATENGLEVKKGSEFFVCRSIMLLPNKNAAYFEIKSLNPLLKSRYYEGALVIELTNKKNLKIKNNIELNDYLEGVVESESGVGQLFEYYKVQSIISRTFALKNWNKHEKDGFNLCDQVHCQAYLHKRNSSNKLIDSAVLSTSENVLIASDSTFAPTFFHANCGGQISDPEWVWNSSIEGLNTFEDPFCRNTKQATWVKSIPVSKWRDFFKTTYNFPIEDSIYDNLLFEFNQDQRMSFFIHPQFGIPLRDIREHFRLKSTFFSVKHVDKNIVISGKGFGHGVGLCQEGAMQMAKQGYTYDEILNFYFPNCLISKELIIHW